MRLISVTIEMHFCFLIAENAVAQKVNPILRLMCTRRGFLWAWAYLNWLDFYVTMLLFCLSTRDSEVRQKLLF